MKTIIEEWHDELESDNYSKTMATIYEDSCKIGKIVDSYYCKGEQQQTKILNNSFSVFSTSLDTEKNEKSMKPHAKAKKRTETTTALTHSPMCGAHSRQTGEPCRQPAMRARQRCRLHGGKSSGRPIVDGLQAVAYIKHKKRLALLEALILAD